MMLSLAALALYGGWRAVWGGQARLIDASSLAVESALSRRTPFNLVQPFPYRPRGQPQGALNEKFWTRGAPLKTKGRLMVRGAKNEF